MISGAHAMILPAMRTLTVHPFAMRSKFPAPRWPRADLQAPPTKMGVRRSEINDVRLSLSDVR